jgi:glucose-1-phosphate thymidylyltransferase
MIYYPIEVLVQAEIRDILIVTGGNDAGEFLRLLGNGKAFGLKHINYTYQEGEGGIADALRLAEFFCGGEKVCVILGDNIIEKDIVQAARAFEKQAVGAKILLKQVLDPQRFGVPVFENGKVIRIDEKPVLPQSDYAVTGIYFYDPQVFDLIRPLKPSARGELEISDLNNAYIERGEMTWDILDGWWTDAGTFDSLLLANQLMAKSVCR